MTGTPTPVTSVPMNQDLPPSSLSMMNFSQQITEKLNDKNFLLWKQQIDNLYWSQFGFGGLEGKQWSLDQVLRPSTGALQLLQLIFCGFRLYSVNLQFLISLLWCCDNSSAVQMAHNPVLHAKTKHMELDLFFVREKVLSKKLIVQHIPGYDQWADLLTKPLWSARFSFLSSKLNVSELPLVSQSH